MTCDMTRLRTHAGAENLELPKHPTPEFRLSGTGMWICTYIYVYACRMQSLFVERKEISFGNNSQLDMQGKRSISTRTRLFCVNSNIFDINCPGPRPSV